jgi:hypothetical protein
MFMTQLVTLAQLALHLDLESCELLVILEHKLYYLHVFFPLRSTFCYFQCQDIRHVNDVRQDALGYVPLHWPDLCISVCIIKSVIKEKEKIDRIPF